MIGKEIMDWEEMYEEYRKRNEVVSPGEHARIEAEFVIGLQEKIEPALESLGESARHQCCSEEHQ